MLTFKSLLPPITASVLLILAGLFHSVGFAVTSVALLTVLIVRESIADYYSTKLSKNSIPDEAKKAIQDLNARITTIEAGIARRGF